MAAETRIRIPRRDYQALQDLSELQDEEIDRLYRALQKTPPKESATEYAYNVVNSLGESGTDVTRVESIIRLLLSLYQLRSELDLSLSDLTAVLTTALKDARARGLKLGDEGTNIITQRVSQLLSLDDSVGLAAKAQYLRTQFRPSLHFVAVATDIRPVYQSDPSGPPAAAVIVHNLSLQYHQDSQVKELVIELTSKDLQALERAVVRAKRKDQGLRAFMSSINLPVIGESE